MSKSTLKQAVIDQLGYENADDQELIGTCEDIANYGIDGGFGQFVYYADTVEFYDDNEGDIKELCREQAEDLGFTVAEMVEGFGCVNVDKYDIEAFFMGDDENETHLKNALTWFAAEEIAREIANY